jgi:hypothetical protein
MITPIVSRMLDVRLVNFIVVQYTRATSLTSNTKTQRLY